MPLFTSFIQPLLLPPGLFFAMLVLGLLLRPLCRKFSRFLVFSAVALLFLGSTPLVSQWLLGTLQRYPALDTELLATAQSHASGSPQAIVVLGGGRYPDAPEYGQDTVSHGTLVRSRYGAWLARKTGLPLLVSGGIVNPRHTIPEARLMADVLTQEWNMQGVWLETASRNTYENARNSSAMLRERGIDHIYLVTHAWHLPRAIASFHHFGIRVTPAPTGFTLPAEATLTSLWPESGSAMQHTYYALHEYLGLLWYRLYHFRQEPGTTVQSTAGNG